MADRDHLSGRAAQRTAASSWILAGIVYIATEAVAAFAFSPPYSYARNYISDLGVPVCGTIYDGRALCSPLHALVNVSFALQGLLFLGAALAMAQALSTSSRYAFVALAALNCAGNILIGLYPEAVPGQTGSGFGLHLVGAFLAIVFGNATALMSAWTFAELRLSRLHRVGSLTLPLLAAVAFAALLVSRRTGTAFLFPDGVWERISVYAITAWELLSGSCVIARLRSRQAGTSHERFPRAR